MKQRKFEIIVNENVERDDGVKSVVAMRTGNEQEGYICLDFKHESAELTEEQIVEAVNKLMYYMLPSINDKDVPAPAQGVVFKRTPEGNFVKA